MAKKINKIVITGGPCAGKTTGMSWIQNAFDKRGYKVLFVNEAATELINSGIDNDSFSNYDFQSALIKTQLAKEEIFYEAAKKSTNENVLIVCDRGTLDGKAFCLEGVFEQITKDLNKSEVELRDSYDAIFHMVTAAKGAEEFYTLENNTARRETIEEARIADDKLINAWNGHPHFKIIGNEGDFEYKIKQLIDQISKYLNEPILFETKRKYLIEYPDLSLLENNLNIKKVEIYQTYLKSNDEEKIQIRKRGIDNNYVYYQINTRFKNNQLLKEEKRLTKQEYEDKLNSLGSNIRQLHRTRYYMTIDNEVIEFDIYPFYHDKAILNINLNNKDDKINLPSFIKIIEEITNNKNYLNSELVNLI